MPRAIVTQEMVQQAADALAAAGEEPTLITVHERLGAGSYTTISRFLKAWRNEQAVSAAPPDAPPAVQEQLAVFGRAVWKAAIAQAEQDVAQVRTQAERQVAQAQTAVAEAEQVITRLEAAAEEQTRQFVQAQQERDSARSALEKAVVAEQVMNARLEAQTQRLSELQRQIEAQAAELAQARADLLAQAKLAGEVEALRRQLAESTAERPSRRRSGENG
ncbi:MAG: hypothetical protein HC828_01545 [Blastochloris sp.]|nr:hypothetical protein [Blastochloris sp.]